MLSSEPLASLITFLMTSFLSKKSTNVRFFLSHNEIQRIELKKKGSKAYSFHVGQPCFGIFA